MYWHNVAILNVSLNTVYTVYDQFTLTSAVSGFHRSSARPEYLHAQSVIFLMCVG